MSVVRLGIIGCGNNMAGHLRRLSTFPDVEIVAIAEPVKEMVDRVIAQIPALKDVQYYAGHREMLERAEIDAVEISTPHTLHFEHARDSLLAGKHVLVEKPMVCSTEHAEELIKVRDQVGKHLIVNYQRHFRSEYLYCRERFVSGVWSAPYFIQGWQCADWKVRTTGKWRQNPALSGGGQLSDSGSHLLDILLWVSGQKPKEVFAFVDNRGLEVDVLSAISVRFENGAIGTISVIGDSHTHPRGIGEGLYFWHDQGMAEISGEADKPRLIVRDPEERVIEASEMPAASTPDRNFIDAILGKDEIRSTAESALEVVRLTEAAIRSASTGQPVVIQR